MLSKLNDDNSTIKWTRWWTDAPLYTILSDIMHSCYREGQLNKITVDLSLSCIVYSCNISG